MALDSEDTFPQGDSSPFVPNPVSQTAQRLPPALAAETVWWATRPPEVAVVVKKRRLSLNGPNGGPNGGLNGGEVPTVHMPVSDAVEAPPAQRPASSLPDRPAPPGTEATAATGAVGGERRPRVFVLSRDDAVAADTPASADTTPQPDAAASAATPRQPALRRRRRASPLHRPSPVVRIVPPPQPAAEPAGLAPGLSSETAGDGPFPRLQPSLDEYRAIQAALRRLKGLVHDAQRARGWVISPAAGRRRARSG
jgi:hypothetical protein